MDFLVWRTITTDIHQLQRDYDYDVVVCDYDTNRYNERNWLPYRFELFLKIQSRIEEPYERELSVDGTLFRLITLYYTPSSWSDYTKTINKVGLEYHFILEVTTSTLDHTPQPRHPCLQSTEPRQEGYHSLNNVLDQQIFTHHRVWVRENEDENVILYGGGWIGKRYSFSRESGGVFV